jgi:methionyl-tRNA formyltransferase
LEHIKDLKIIGVHAQEDRRGKNDCEEKALQLGLPLKTYDEIVKAKPDIFLSIYYLKKIKKDLIDNCLCVNLHSAKLPEYRGRNTFAHAIQNGELNYTMTLHLMTEEFDEGDIITERTFPIEFDDTCWTLYKKAQEVAFQMFVDALPNILDETFTTKKQVGIPRYYDKNLDKELKMDMTAYEFYNKIRSLDFPPYEPAYLMVGGKKIHLKVVDYESL